MTSNMNQQAKIIALRIAKAAQDRVVLGVKKAAAFLAARLKECVSVPAPRKRVANSRGDIRYVATLRATPGAPPRKLSGKLRQSITWTVKVPAAGGTHGRGKVSGFVGLKARSANNANYPRILEYKGHPFLGPTIKKHRAELIKLVGSPFKGVLS